MVRHHQKEREKGFKRNIVINAVGSAATLIVLLIVATTKFTSGAWVPLIVIPLIVVVFKAIKRHYRTVADGLRVTPDYKPRRMNHTVVVLVGGVHRGVLEGLAYARSLSPNHLVAVSVVSDEEDQERLERQWQEFGIEVPLEIVYSPVPRAHPPDPPVRRRARRAGGRTTSSRCSCPSSSCATGGATCSTTRPHSCSRAASCSGRARWSRRCPTTSSEAAEPREIRRKIGLRRVPAPTFP